MWKWVENVVRVYIVLPYVEKKYFEESYGYVLIGDIYNTYQF